jgi:hypothetical protein
MKGGDDRETSTLYMDSSWYNTSVSQLNSAVCNHHFEVARRCGRTGFNQIISSNMDTEAIVGDRGDHEYDESIEADGN